MNFDKLSWNILGEVTLNYGKFLTAIINFLIMAFVLFCIVKAMNKLMEMGKHEEPAAEEPAAQSVEAEAASGNEAASGEAGADSAEADAGSASASAAA